VGHAKRGFLTWANAQNFLTPSKRGKSYWKLQNRTSSQLWSSIVIFMTSLHSTPRKTKYSPSRFHHIYPHQINKLNGALHSVVAVIRLGGHAFGSWRSRNTRKMWLKDFLPHEVRRIRIFSYGYNSQPVENHFNEGILDYRRHFLQILGNARRSAEVTKHTDEAPSW
jgi:hypothetical protein